MHSRLFPHSVEHSHMWGNGYRVLECSHMRLGPNAQGRVDRRPLAWLPLGRARRIILIVWCVRYCNKQRTQKRQQRNNVVMLENDRSFKNREPTQGVC